MPTASPELRNKFPGGDSEAHKVLEDAGYTLTPQWNWRKPSPDHVITARENDAIDYLIFEWDYGDVEPSGEN